MSNPMFTANLQSVNNQSLPPFWGFSAFTPTIPKLYWNVKSQEQRILNLFDLLDKLICYANELGISINASADDIAKLRKDFESLKDGKLWDFYEQQISAWITANMQGLIQQALLQFVIPSINDRGYFVLHIPNSWNEIQFDFGAVFGRSDYGRIILRYDVDNGITNTYAYSLAQTQPLQKLIADLEVNTKRTDATYNKVFSNISEGVTRNAN